MIPEGFLATDRIEHTTDEFSKKRLLQHVSGLLAKSGNQLTGNDIFDRLMERERLGATGLGHGVGLPHARVQGILRARAAVMVLDKPVAYDAEDKQPVDLICALIVPEDENTHHLEILGSLARVFSDSANREQLKSLRVPSDILSTFHGLLQSEA